METDCLQLTVVFIHPSSCVLRRAEGRRELTYDFLAHIFPFLSTTSLSLSLHFFTLIPAGGNKLLKSHKFCMSNAFGGNSNMLQNITGFGILQEKKNAISPMRSDECWVMKDEGERKRRKDSKSKREKQWREQVWRMAVYLTMGRLRSDKVKLPLLCGVWSPKRGELERQAGGWNRICERRETQRRDRKKAAALKTSGSHQRAERKNTGLSWNARLHCLHTLLLHIQLTPFPQRHTI